MILAGEIKRKIALKGLRVSKGARAAIEAAGGSVELPAAPAEAAQRRRNGRPRTRRRRDGAPKAE